MSPRIHVILGFSSRAKTSADSDGQRILKEIKMANYHITSSHYKGVILLKLCIRIIFGGAMCFILVPYGIGKKMKPKKKKSSDRSD